jgi:hypothetical protein
MTLFAREIFFIPSGFEAIREKQFLNVLRKEKLGEKEMKKLTVIFGKISSNLWKRESLAYS